MVESAPNIPESSTVSPGPSLVVTAWEMATGNLLRDNVFRGLGLSVLASGREIAKRAEEFRLSRELDSEIAAWAFAPDSLWSADRTRAALQNLSDPFRRLIGEIFWYWPASYPENSGDASLSLLAANDPAAAVAQWIQAQEKGDLGALHNLAVYHLMMALELEGDPATADSDDLSHWWEAAIRFWQLATEQEDFWRRLEKRVVAMADPQIRVEAVALLRGVFPDVLGGINGSLALKAVEANDQKAASRHIVLLGRIYERSDQLDAALARSVRSVVRRLDAWVADAYRALEAGAEDVLGIAKTFVEHGSPDIHSLNTLCGSDSAVATSAVAEVSQLILEIVAAPRDDAGNDPHGLVPLAYVHGLRNRSEVDRRVHNFYRMALSNAVKAHARSVADPAYARLYAVVAEQMVVEWQSWDLQSAPRQLIAAEIADQLRETARQALSERDDIAFAMHAYELLLQLPCEAPEAARRLEDRDRAQKDFESALSHAVSLVHGQNSFQLDHRILRWNDRQWPIEQVTSVRFGVVTNPKTNARTRMVAIRLENAEILLDEMNLFGGPHGIEDYAQVTAALEYFVIPPLVKRVVAAIRGGDVLQLADLTVTRDEVIIASAVRIRNQPISIRHGKLQHRTENDAWSVVAGENNHWRRKYLIVDTWNAVIMGRVIATLAEAAALSSANE